jgi:hypothetical protein
LAHRKDVHAGEVVRQIAVAAAALELPRKAFLVDIVGAIGAARIAIWQGIVVKTYQVRIG